MATNILIKITDQYNTGISNVQVGVCSTDKQTNQTILHGQVDTNSLGEALFTHSSSSFAVDYPEIFFIIQYGGEILETTNEFSTDEMVSMGFETSYTLLTNTTNTFSGHVYDQGTSFPIDNLEITCHNVNDILTPVNLFGDVVITDKDGSFYKLISDPFFAVKHPLIYFVVKQGTTVKYTSPSIDPLALFGVPQSTLIDADLGNITITRTVSGIVVDSERNGVDGDTVKVYTVTPGQNDDTEVATTTTASDGTYSAQFDQNLQGLTDLSVNLRIKVFTGTTLQRTSPLILNSEINETINLVTGEDSYKGTPKAVERFEKCDAEIGSIDLSSITESEIAIIAGKADLPVNEAATVMAAMEMKSAIDSTLNLADPDKIPVATCYALIESGFDGSMASVFGMKKSMMEQVISEAAENNVIPQSEADDAANNIGNIVDYVADRAVTPTSPKSEFRQIMETISLDPATMKSVVTYYINNDSDTGFWNDIEANLSAYAEDIKTVIRMSYMTLNNASMIDKIFTTFSDYLDMTTYTVSQWATYIAQELIPVPDCVPGDSQQEQEENYAQVIYNNIEAYFSTEKMLYATGVLTGMDETSMKDFMKDNPDFSLDDDQMPDNLDNYDYTGLQASEPVAEFKDDLMVLWRLNQVTPMYDKENYIKFLYAQGCNSAIDIAVTGKPALKVAAAEGTEQLDDEAIDTIVNKANAITLQTISLYTMVAHDNEYINKKFFEPTEDVISIDEIFGSLDYSNVKHCRSVYGAAAYLADLLGFLKGCTKQSGTNYLTKLTNRRPDIENILLNCENTNTAMPSIDLVIEQLEALVAGSSATNLQTTLPSEDLKVYPENLNTTAYNTLRDAIFPWHQPFHLWNTEARAYLKYMGIERYAMMRDLPGAGNTIFDDAIIAAEYFGFEPMTSNDEEDYLNPVMDNLMGNIYPVQDGYDLEKVQNLIDFTGIDYEKLKLLIQSHQVNPNNKTITFNSNEPFSLKDATLSFNDSELITLHFYVKMLSKLGWEPWELDHAIDVFGMEDGSKSLLVDLYYLEEIRKITGLSVCEQLTWWGNMENITSYENHTNLYKSTFIGADESNVDSSFTSLDPDGSNDVNGKTHLHHILGALGTSEIDFVQLIDSIGITQTEINYCELSKIYAHNTFQKHLGITMEEYILFNSKIQKSAIGTYDKTEPGTFRPSDSLGVIREFERIKNAGLSIHDLNYFLDNEGDQYSTFFPKPESSIAFLTDLRTMLKATYEDFFVAGQSMEDILKDVLLHNISAEAKKFIDHIQGKTIMDSTDLGNIINLYSNETCLLFNDSTQTFQDLSQSYIDDETSIELFSKNCSGKAKLESLEDVNDFITSTLLDATTAFINWDSEEDGTEAGTSDLFIDNHGSTLLSGIDSGALSSLSRASDALGDHLTTEARQRYVIGELAQVDEMKVKLKDTLSQYLKRYMDDPATETAINLIFYGTVSNINEEEFVIEFFSPFCDTTEAIDSLIENTSPIYIINSSERAYYILNCILKTVLREEAYKAFSDYYEMDLEILKYLFESIFVLQSGSTSYGFVDFFKSRWFINSNIVFTTTSSYYEKLMKLSRALTFIKYYKFSDKDIKCIQEYKSFDNNWIDFNCFLDSPNYTTGDLTYDQWVNLNDAAVFSAMNFKNEYSLFGFIHDSSEVEQTDLESYNTLLSEYTGWTNSDITAYSTMKFSGLLPANINSNISLLYPLKTVHEYTSVLSLGLEEVINLNLRDLTSTGSKQIYNLAKASTSKSQWFVTAGALRDSIRIPQRNALAAYVIYKLNNTIGSYDDLYNYILMDAETGVENMTSRIKQATLAIQLYVQRIFLQLEADQNISEDMNEQWFWRKHYRLWEANRKVFLQPENYLDPELRVNTSPFYDEFMSGLDEVEINEENVSNLYRDYLSKLDEVSHLEIVAISENKTFSEESTDEPKETHIIGRTYNIPHIYYHRKYSSGCWTPWKRLDINIEGENIAIATCNGVPVISWLSFEKIAIEPQDISTTQKPNIQYKIYLNWATLNSNKVECHKTVDFFTTDSKKTIVEKNFVLEMGNYGHYPLAAFISYISDPDFGYISKQSSWSFVNENTLNPVFNESPGFNGYHREQGIHYQKFINNIISIGNYNLIYTHSNRFYLQYPSSNIINHSKIEPRFFYLDNLAMYSFQGQNTNETYIAHKSVSGSNITLSPQILLPEIASPANPTTTAIGKSVAIKSDDRIISPAFYDARMENYSIDRQNNTVTTDDSGTATTTIKWVGSRAYSGNDLPDTLPKSDELQFDINCMFHPYTDLLQKEVNQYGVSGILAPGLNSDIYLRQGNSETFPYQTTDWVIVKDNLEFDFASTKAYSIYNWELFYHIPMAIADRLMKENQFEEAQKWLNYIFDPTIPSENTESGAKNFFRFKPFYKYLSTDHTADNFYGICRDEFGAQIDQWIENPFNPHAIASMRVLAYIKYTVMKYLDNLIAWGDHLYRENTMESINEATQYYMLAAQILGRQPVGTRDHEPADVDFAGIDTYQNDLLNNFTVLMDDTLGIVGNSNGGSQRKKGSQPAGMLANVYKTLYFGLPKNDKFLSYWQIVADRLFKIRHSMNIDGGKQSLPLFEPPIDPALISKALANGVNIGEAISGLYTALPQYRFRGMLSRAIDYTRETISLGKDLLSSIEKQESEAFSLLKNKHEAQILDIVNVSKINAVEDAKNQIEGLKILKANINNRKSYYDSLNKTGKIQAELNQLSHLNKAMIHQEEAFVSSLIGLYLTMIPNTTIGISGFSGSPVSTFTLGGSLFSGQLNAISGMFGQLSGIQQSKSSKSGIKGGWERRAQEWQLQIQQAEKELEKVEKDIISAEIRLAMAENDLKNHELQMEHNQEVFAFMEDKFTNEQLYAWMKGQLSSLYHNAYTEAFDLAKQAEKTYQFELDDAKTTFISLGKWDSLKRGLTAGEHLLKELKTMEKSYMENDKRKFEMKTNISLMSVAPEALLSLKDGGSCSFNIPEAIFDLQAPGQYKRRIKSVSVTIPAVTGPYNNIHCKLTLTGSKYRKNTVATGAGDYGYTGINDPRFIHNPTASESIMTSGAQNDSGLFEFNFNSEKYLPFEGAGAISDWSLELPSEFRQFDYNSISDVILHINYTAQEDGVLGGHAESYLSSNLKEALKMYSEGEDARIIQAIDLKSAFSTEFNDFMNPDTGNPNSATFTLTNDHFPYFLKDEDKGIKEVEFLVITENENDITSIKIEVDSQYDTSTFSSVNEESALYTASTALPETGYDVTTGSELSLTIEAGDNFNNPTKVLSNAIEVTLLIKYTI